MESIAVETCTHSTTCLPPDPKPEKYLLVSHTKPSLQLRARSQDRLKPFST